MHNMQMQMQNGLKRMFFRKEKKLAQKEKYFMEISVLNGYPCKKVSNFFFNIHPFQNILHLFYLVQKKNTILVTVRGFPPPWVSMRC